MRTPARSARRHATKLNISRESVRRILQRDLRFHPYKIMVVQELKVRDHVQHEDFAVRMQEVFEEEENPIILMSDKAHFHLNGTVNKQNCRYWSPVNPHNIHQWPLRSELYVYREYISTNKEKAGYIKLLIDGTATGWMYSEANQRYNKQYSELCSRSLCTHKIKEIAYNWLYAVNGGRPVWKPMRIYTVYGTILLDL